MDRAKSHTVDNIWTVSNPTVDNTPHYSLYCTFIHRVYTPRFALVSKLDHVPLQQTFGPPGQGKTIATRRTAWWGTLRNIVCHIVVNFFRFLRCFQNEIGLICLSRRSENSFGGGGTKAAVLAD